MDQKPLAVLDTSALISAFVTPQGVASRLLAEAGSRYMLVTSVAILGETASRLLGKAKLRKAFSYTDDDVARYIAVIRNLAGMVLTDPPALSGVVRDPNDDMIVACAAAVTADYLITRDKDLLSLGRYAGTSMVTPREFLDALGIE